MVIAWLDTGAVVSEIVILDNSDEDQFFFFYIENSDEDQALFGHISGMVGQIDVTQKSKTLDGYWV